MSLPVTMTPVFGPIVARAILQHASWRWLFLVNLPIGALALGLAVLFLPRDGEAPTRRRLDWLGLALLSPVLALFLYGVERTSRSGGSVFLGAGVAMMAAFVWHARTRGRAALVDLGLFRIPVFATGTTVLFFYNGIVFVGQMR